MTPPYSWLSFNSAQLGPLEAIDKVRQIKAMLTDHPHPNFSEPYPRFIPSLEQLEECSQRLKTAYDEALNHDSGKIAIRNDIHSEMKRKIWVHGQYMELASEGDVNLLKSTGHDVRKPVTKKAQSSDVSTQVVVVTARHGGEGIIILKATGVKKAASFFVQMTEGDGINGAEWKDVDVYRLASGIAIKGLTPGKLYSFRIQVLTAAGRGPWSTPCTLRSL